MAMQAEKAKKADGCRRAAAAFLPDIAGPGVITTSLFPVTSEHSRFSKAKKGKK